MLFYAQDFCSCDDADAEVFGLYERIILHVSCFSRGVAFTPQFQNDSVFLSSAIRRSELVYLLSESLSPFSSKS